MKRTIIEPTSEETLFREMTKALPYLESGIDWSDLKRHRRAIRVDRMRGR